MNLKKILDNFFKETKEDYVLSLLITNLKEKFSCYKNTDIMDIYAQLELTKEELEKYEIEKITLTEKELKTISQIIKKELILTIQEKIETIYFLEIEKIIIKKYLKKNIKIKKNIYKEFLESLLGNKENIFLLKKYF